MLMLKGLAVTSNWSPSTPLMIESTASRSGDEAGVPKRWVTNGAAFVKAALTVPPANRVMPLMPPHQSCDAAGFDPAAARCCVNELGLQPPKKRSHRLVHIALHAFIHALGGQLA